MRKSSKAGLARAAAAVAGLLALTGCQTLQETSRKLGSAVGIEDSRTASATGGAALGCAAGGVVGVATGHGFGKGCVAGGVALGAVSLYVAHQRELEEAKRLQEDLRRTAPAARVDVRERTVQVKEKGETKKVSALDKMTIDLPADGVNRKTADTRAVLEKAARLAQSSSREVRIEIQGTAAQTKWMGSVLDETSGGKVKWTSRTGSAPKLTLTPIPTPR